SRSVTTGSKPWVLDKAINIYHLCQGKVNLFFDVCGTSGNGPEEFPRARRLGAKGGAKCGEVRKKNPSPGSRYGTRKNQNQGATHFLVPKFPLGSPFLCQAPP